jgi:DNA-binding MarR family transcriptional regulator
MELSGRPLFDNPLDAELFVPRPEVERLQRNCRDGTNTLLLGGFGAGKTSLLRNVFLRLRGDGQAAAWIDGAFADDVVGLLGLIEDDLRQASIEVPVPLPFGPGETAAVLAAMRNLRNHIPGDERVVILLDLAPGGVDPHTLFGRFRDELWQLPLTWIVAAPITMRGQLTTPPADAFFEDVIELGPLSIEQQQELVRRRMDPGDTASWHIPGEGEGNPRRLLQLVREIVRTGEPIDAHFVARSARDAELESLSQSARVVYEYLEENGPTSASDEDLLTHLSWSRQRAAKVLAELEDNDLVRSETRQSRSGRPRKLFAIVPPAP